MKVYVVCAVWDWENEEVDKVFSTREKAVNYIADKIIEYKDEDDDEEIMENTLDEIKAKLQKNKLIHHTNHQCIYLHFFYILLFY